jgi:hypothetical protein
MFLCSVVSIHNIFTVVKKMFAACKLSLKLVNEKYTKQSIDNPLSINSRKVFVGCGVAQIVVRRLAVRQAQVSRKEWHKPPNGVAT